ncbi:MAG: hypothetical protein AAF739_09570 [Pseudomonadota bacterium]
MNKDHIHAHLHDHDHAHTPGHNHSHDHMHSHVHVDSKKERQDRLNALAASFIDGFRNADDKPAFLELAGIPTSRTGADGLKMHLVDATVEAKWQLGTASPAFGSRELVYLPYPASMVGERETMTFTYVSLTQREDVDLFVLFEQRNERAG